jgi:hypothetical protein
MNNGLGENIHYLIYAHGVVWPRIMCNKQEV